MKLNYCMKKKCVCNNFKGILQPSGWENIILKAKDIKNINLKILETNSKKILSISCKNGALNIIIEPQELMVKGNFFLGGESINDITALPLWNLFEFIARTFCIDASLHFYPYVDRAIEFKEGILQDALQFSGEQGFDQIHFFFQKCWINYLLERLHVALKTNDAAKIQYLKSTLKEITIQS